MNNFCILSISLRQIKVFTFLSKMHLNLSCSKLQLRMFHISYCFIVSIKRKWACSSESIVRDEEPVQCWLQLVQHTNLFLDWLVHTMWPKKDLTKKLCDTISGKQHEKCWKILAIKEAEPEMKGQFGLDCNIVNRQQFLPKGQTKLEGFFL